MHGRTRPVPRDIAELESLESRVIWEYIGHDPPLNARRTLDQYGYPSLRDTYARDDDQMLYKLTKERLALQPKNKQETYNMHVEGERPSIISPGTPFAIAAETPMKSETASYIYESDEELEEELDEELEEEADDEVAELVAASLGGDTGGITMTSFFSVPHVVKDKTC